MGEDGSAVSKGLGWTLGTVGSLWEKASEGIGGLVGDGDDDGVYMTVPRCSEGHKLLLNQQGDAPCNLCRNKGTRYSCSQTCNYNICTKCWEKPPPSAQSDGNQHSSSGRPGSSGFDDDWGEDAPPAP